MEFEYTVDRLGALIADFSMILALIRSISLSGTGQSAHTGEL
jgi:hypothetical protein